jgi:endoribonuclease Dicer
MKRKLETKEMGMSPLPKKKICLDRKAMIEFLFNGLEEVEKTIAGYVFRDKLLLIQAVTDTSFKKNCLTESYNEQEWIGDRVLGKQISNFF